MNTINPYPRGSVSHQIYENNRIDPGKMINEAQNIDKIIIYLYVMGSSIRKIAKKVKLSVSTITRRLDKYEVKYK